MQKENRHKEKMEFVREKFNKLYELELRKQDSREMKLNVLKESNELQKKTNSLLELILQKKNRFIIIPFTHMCYFYKCMVMF